MRLRIPVLTAVLAAQLALAGGLALRGDPLAGRAPNTPLVPASAATADRIVIEQMPGKTAAAGSNQLELVKRNGVWTLPDNYNAPADKIRIGTLLDGLVALKRGLPIATTASALRRFKVADHDFVRRLTLSRHGKLISTVYFGTSWGPRGADARTAQDHAVYSVDLPTYDLPTSVSEWFDNDALERMPQTIAGVAVERDGWMLQLRRQSAPATSHSKSNSQSAGSQSKSPVGASTGGSGTWQAASALPAGMRLNAANVETLINTIAELNVDSVVGDQLKPEWNQDHPLLTLELTDGKGRKETWTISKASKGKLDVLKSSAHPWYFSISPGTAQELLSASARNALLMKTPVHAAAGARKARHRAARTASRTAAKPRLKPQRTAA